MPELICRAEDRTAWQAVRSASVTATDIVIILGLSLWTSLYSLFWQKMGQVPAQPGNDRLRLGRELEPLVLARWYEATGTAPISASRRGRLLRSSDRPWQMATIDAEGPDGPVEAKTRADADRDSWGPSGPYSGPPSVRAQVLWQMDVMDAAVGHVAVLFLPSGEFRHYTVEHEMTGDPGHWAPDHCQTCRDLKMMRAAGEEFYKRLRMELPPPDPDSSAATLAAVKARFARAKGKRGQVDHDLWNLWLHAKNQRDDWEKYARGYESNIREQLGEADEIEVDGQVVGRRVIFDQPKPAYVLHKDYIRRISGSQADVGA